MGIKMEYVMYFNSIKWDDILDVHLDFYFTYIRKYKEPQSNLFRMSGTSTTVWSLG
jgi:hypothetical protein